jgi:hypothetical protein
MILKDKQNGKPFFVKELKVRQSQISFSYSSHTLQINELLSSKGNKLEYLNIFNINDLTLDIKAYELK